MLVLFELKSSAIGIALYAVVPGLLGTSLRDDEFGLPINLFVGILPLLLNVASNAALTAQTYPPLISLYTFLSLPFLLHLNFSFSMLFDQPLSHSLYLPFYSFPLVGIQIVNFVSVHTQFLGLIVGIVR